MSVWVNAFRIRKCHHDPDDGSGELDRRQDGRDDQLRPRWNVRRPTSWLRGRMENPGNSVSLGQERAVDETEKCQLSYTVWPDWAIYCTLSNFSKPVVKIILPILPTFLSIFLKVSKSFIALVKSFLGNFYRLLATFYWSYCLSTTLQGRVAIDQWIRLRLVINWRVCIVKIGKRYKLFHDLSHLLTIKYLQKGGFNTT